MCCVMITPKDALAYSNAWFRVTHTWVGDPEVFWDKDLYDGPPTRMAINTVKDPATGLYLNVSSIWTLTGKKIERVEIAHVIVSNEILTIKALRAGGVDI